MGFVCNVNKKGQKGVVMRALELTKILNLTP